ncbi:glycosyl hydrolase [Leptodontidium sp. MPI-SDFR-AT-0119]|nr:glycosyl hydrolase [Leptodontidium sp. MPI-SDFR-AT-0119]
MFGKLFARKATIPVEGLPQPPVATVEQTSHVLSRPASLDIIRQGDIRSRGSKRAQSYRLITDFIIRYEQPWLKDKRMGRTWINNVIVYGFMLLGLAISGYICYSKAKSVVKHDFCLIMDDSFSTINPAFWSHEIQTGGYGTGSFDWTTDDAANSYVNSEGLHIRPTLTNMTTKITNAQIDDGYTVNLTSTGECTSSVVSNCAIHSNRTLGTVIPPVRSARMTTKGKKSIRYGKVEVTARLPKGDWIWPAIWMMPEDEAYGPWPRSGEIDMMEARGNNYSFPDGGRDVFTSSLHWGPTVSTDAYWRATVGKKLRRSDYSNGYHTFGLEWTKDYLLTYVDFELQQVLYWSFKGQWDMWKRGYFSSQTANGTLIQNPWSQSPNVNAPFDKPFYLILNVAIGSQNGWFRDAVGGKPWIDGGATTVRDFWNAADSWLPTWGDGDEGSLTVKSVKMWELGKC